MKHTELPQLRSVISADGMHGNLQGHLSLKIK